MEQYVRITRVSNTHKWYAGYIGRVYPVKQDSIYGYTLFDSTYSIDKSDCELVSITVNTMPEEKNQPSEPLSSDAEASTIKAMARDSASRSFDPYDRVFDVHVYGFIAGFKCALQQSKIKGEKELLSKGDISKQRLHYSKTAETLGETTLTEAGEWLEKAKKEGYTITEDQFLHLYSILGAHSCLQEWFPNAEVFQPKKYVVTVKDSNSKEGYYLHEIGGVIKITQDIEKAHQFKNTAHILGYIKSKHPELICYAQEV